MKFYIGSSFKNHKLVNLFAEKLKQYGWEHTYNWGNSIQENETEEDLIAYSRHEQKGIFDSDIVIILLPGGRGTHIELGMALAWGKKIYLYSANGEEFKIENTVNFYQMPEMMKLTGNVDDVIQRIIKEN